MQVSPAFIPNQETAQDIFNRVAEVMVEQGGPAVAQRTMPSEGPWSGLSLNSCLYRTPSQRRCAVGAMIPDHAYRPDFEGRPLIEVIAAGCPRYLAYYDLLRALQRCHDNARSEYRESIGERAWIEPFGILGIYTLLAGDAKRFDLSTEVLDKAFERYRPLKKWERQELFDYVVDELVKQGGPALSNGDCQYRAPGARKCALGHVIPDHLYKPDMEGKNLAGLVERDWLPPNLEEHVDLLRGLQRAHDTAAYIGHGSSSKWSKGDEMGRQSIALRLEELATIFGLNMIKVWGFNLADKHDKQEDSPVFVSPAPMVAPKPLKSYDVPYFTFTELSFGPLT